MGTCLSKKKESSPSTPIAEPNSATPPSKNSSGNGVPLSKPKMGTEPEADLKKEKEVKGHVKKEIFIIKHRKSHDDGGQRNSRSQQNAHQPFEEMHDRIAQSPAGAANMGVVVRTSSCTKEEVDAILIQCGRLSRNSSGKQATSSSGGFGRRHSGSKRRSHDFDHCDDNDTISTEEDQKEANTNVNRSDLCEDDGIAAAEKRQRHRQSSRSSSLERSRRRTPSREREQQQRSSSRERRVSRSPGRRSSETTAPVANARNSNNNTSSTRPGKMVSVPATVSSLVMDKSNNGGGEFATTTGVKRIMVKRNVGGASPRSQSPARANGNAANASKVLSENQQHPSLSRNSSRKAEHSPYRRIPLSEVEPNNLAFPHSTANNNSSRVQNRPKKEIETEANQKPNACRAAMDKGLDVNCKTKVQQEEDVKVQSSMTDNVVVKTVITSEVDNLKPQILTRSRSSRRSRDLDLNPEALLNPPPQSYTSLLLEDIHNFHQKNTPPVSLPACVTKACAILEAVADLNSNTSSDFSQHGYQSSRNEYNVLFGTTTDHGKRVPDTKDSIVEYESFVNDDVMEPSLHNYMTVNRDGSLGGVDMEDQESSGSNSFTQQQRYIQGISSSSWEPSSGDSKDLCTSRLNNSREQCQKSPLGLEGRVSREAARDVDGARKQLNSIKNVCDHQHGSRIGRGRVGGNKVLHARPVVTAAEST